MFYFLLTLLAVSVSFLAYLVLIKIPDLRQEIRELEASLRLEKGTTDVLSHINLELEDDVTYWRERCEESD